MPGATDHALVDVDATLARQLVDQLLHRVLRHHLVLVALNDQAGGGAGGEEAEVVHVGRRRHRDEAVDLRPAHQELHADPGAEGEAGDPARLGVVVVGLQPVWCRGRIRKLSLARSEELRAGKEGVSTWRSRCWPSNKKKK